MIKAVWVNGEIMVWVDDQDLTDLTVLENGIEIYTEVKPDAGPDDHGRAGPNGE